MIAIILMITRKEIRGIQAIRTIIRNSHSNTINHNDQDKNNNKANKNNKTANYTKSHKNNNNKNNKQHL